MEHEFKQLTQLTVLQEAGERNRAFRAFQKEYAERNPIPDADVDDLFQDNPTVARRLTTWVSYIPMLLLVIMVASVIISSDKTMRAMHDSVAGASWLWGAWSVVVTACAMIMLEGGLIVAEFAQVRDRIAKQLPRRVLNLSDMARGIAVRIGGRPGRKNGTWCWVRVYPLDYSEMPDPTLSFYSWFMFAMVLLANTYGVLYAYTDGFENRLILNDWDQILEFTIFFIVGIGGALSLRLTGSQLAHMSHDLYAQQRGERQRAILEEWRAELEREFEAHGEKYIQAALHQKFLKINDLPFDADSPYYCLTPGSEGEFELVPFRASSEPSLNGRPNGNGTNGTH